MLKFENVMAGSDEDIDGRWVHMACDTAMSLKLTTFSIYGSYPTRNFEEVINRQSSLGVSIFSPLGLHQTQ